MHESTSAQTPIKPHSFQPRRSKPALAVSDCQAEEAACRWDRKEPGSTKRTQPVRGVVAKIKPKRKIRGSFQETAVEAWILSNIGMRIEWPQTRKNDTHTKRERERKKDSQLQGVTQSFCVSRVSCASPLFLFFSHVLFCWRPLLLA